MKDVAEKLNCPLENAKIKIATARCARVSYLNFEGKDDYNADIKLHERLATMGHASPFEHCAKAMGNEDYLDHQHTMGRSGNFKGFIQYRKFFKDECRSDSRVIKK